jgi:hypothetical protein
MFRLFKISFLLVFLIAMSPNKTLALNTYEISLIGVGVGLIYNQYFDSSLDNDNSVKLKRDVILKFLESKKTKVNPVYFRQLPIQEKLLVIDRLNHF